MITCYTYYIIMLAANEMGEDKTNQFLGASMVSNGERFMVRKIPSIGV